MLKNKSQITVVPELVASFSYDTAIIADYRCSCGGGISENYICCPWCGAKLDWSKHHKSKESAVFRDFIDSL